jgi:hypothetical protein
MASIIFAMMSDMDSGQPAATFEIPLNRNGVRGLGNAVAF